MPEITDEELATLQAQAARGAQADELAAEVERLTPLANELEAARNETTQATAAARAAIIAANPTIPADLIQGEVSARSSSPWPTPRPSPTASPRPMEATARLPPAAPSASPPPCPKDRSAPERIRWALNNKE
jgi:hypothetical protein